MPDRILVVDDEPKILSALSRMLADQDLEVLTATSGLAGLELLAEHEVAVVISDQRMPEMAGDEFLRHVRQRQPGAVRMVLTGYADMEAVKSLINASGIHRYITKPWDDDELQMIIQNAVAFHKMVVENARLNQLTKLQNQELKELTGRLKQRVGEQTAQLREQNQALLAANGRLKQTQRAVLETFCSLIELFNASMGGHCRRVAAHAEAMARQLGLPEARVEAVTTAGLLHDIGKVAGNPASVAKKLETLDRSEREFIRKHPLLGQTALLAIEDFKEAGLLIRHHHERFDGRGYPDGLKGDEIPVGARIIAVANTFDHLMEHAEGLSMAEEEQACGTLRAQGGRLLDPDMILLLEEVLHRGRRVESGQAREAKISLVMLGAGMVLAQDLRTQDGMMIAPRGVMVDERLLDAIWKFKRAGRIDSLVHVFRSS